MFHQTNNMHRFLNKLKENEFPGISNETTVDQMRNLLGLMK